MYIVYRLEISRKFSKYEELRNINYKQCRQCAYVEEWAGLNKLIHPEEIADEIC